MILIISEYWGCLPKDQREYRRAKERLTELFRTGGPMALCDHVGIKAYMFFRLFGRRWSIMRSPRPSPIVAE